MSLPLHNRGTCSITQDATLDGKYLYSHSVDASKLSGKRNYDKWLADSTVSSSPLVVALFKKCRVQSPQHPSVSTSEIPPYCSAHIANGTRSSCIISEGCQLRGFCGDGREPEMHASSPRDESRRRIVRDYDTSVYVTTSTDGKESLVSYTAANQILYKSHQERLHRRRCRASQLEPAGVASKCAVGMPPPGLVLRSNERCMLAYGERLCTTSTLRVSQRFRYSTSTECEALGEQCVCKEFSRGTRISECPIFASDRDIEYEDRIKKAGEGAKDEMKQSWNYERVNDERLHPTSLYCKLNAFIRQLQFS